MQESRHFKDLRDPLSGLKHQRAQSEFAKIAHGCTRLGLSVHT